MTGLCAAQPLAQGFAPISAGDARVLILGSLPGRLSLERREYYAQPRNAFWRLMGDLFDAGPDYAYEERGRRLVRRGVALWDVCRAAVRPGSLDAAIERRTVVVNEFGPFFAAHPAIRLILCNGATAASLYTRLVSPGLAAPAAAIPLRRLPSTSPAHAALPYEAKRAHWEAALGGESR